MKDSDIRVNSNELANLIDKIDRLDRSVSRLNPLVRLLSRFFGQSKEKNEEKPEVKGFFDTFETKKKTDVLNFYKFLELTKKES